MDSSVWLVALAALAGFVLFNVFKGYRSPRLLREAASAVAEGSPLVDVRSREEFQMGHHPRAINIPLQELGGQLDRLGSTERPVVLYCRSGSRSAQAARILTGAGFHQVLDLGPQRNTRHISEKGPAAPKGRIPSSKRRRRR